MVYRHSGAAPQSAVEEPRRGRTVGRFCHGCGSVYPLHWPLHRGKPRYGKDHVDAPCVHEGEAFDPAESWWEPAVELRPAVEAPAEAEVRG